MALDPLAPLFQSIAGWVEFIDGRFEQALSMTAASSARAPDNPQVAFMHTVALAAAGRVSDAIAVTEAIERAKPDDEVTWFSSAMKWALRGEGEKLTASITLERKAWASADPHYALTLAECFAVGGRPDEAFEWLEYMLRTGAAPYRFIAEKDPLLSRIRGDARWPDLVARLKRAAENAARG